LGDPGGAVQADESPNAAVLCELKEDPQAARATGPLAGVTDWVPPQPSRTEGLMAAT
jgi:hypothetical protein